MQTLKLQINFRHHILSQSHSDSSVFKFSCNRKPFSVDRLKENLLKLLGDIPRNNEPPLTDDENDRTSNLSLSDNEVPCNYEPPLLDNTLAPHEDDNTSQPDLENPNALVGAMCTT